MYRLSAGVCIVTRVNAGLGSAGSAGSGNLTAGSSLGAAGSSLAAAGSSLGIHAAIIDSSISSRSARAVVVIIAATDGNRPHEEQRHKSDENCHNSTSKLHYSFLL
jgi:hypothetical protein